MKLCLTTRDELRLIELDEVVYLKASGNYTDFHFADSHVKSEASCLSYFAKQIESLYENASSPFIRVGRSHVINVNYISTVNIPKHTVQFHSLGQNTIILPKGQCAELKKTLTTTYNHSSQDKP